MNRWNISNSVEVEVIARDRKCVYCGWEFEKVPSSRGKAPSWEHIVNDLSIVTRDNIVLCCVSCNASKGTKSLAKWLESNYCHERGIHALSIASVARQALLPTGTEVQIHCQAVNCGP